MRHRAGQSVARVCRDIGVLPKKERGASQANEKYPRRASMGQILARRRKVENWRVISRDQSN